MSIIWEREIQRALMTHITHTHIYMVEQELEPCTSDS